jgi:hypothetical protein
VSALLVGVGAALVSMTSAGKDCPACDSFQLETQNVQPSLSVEARKGSFGLMLSYGQSDRKGDAVAGPQYFAAKGEPPLNAHIKQSITAKWVGLQGTYTCKVGHLGLRAMAGFARVWGENYERGTYDYGSGPYWVEHRNSTQETRPLLGIGAEHELSKRWLVKAEWQHISHTVESPWTLSNTINSVVMQLVAVF